MATTPTQSHSSSDDNEAPREGIRLNRYLALCGLGSRRSSEDWIRQGRVTINKKLCMDLSTRVTPDDDVAFDGKSVNPKQETTILLNKPAGVVCTASDPQGRKTIFDLLTPTYRSRNLHHAGRLDQDSEGLLVMTNSGELSQQLTHPRNKIEKEYIVTLDRPFDFQLKKQFQEGIRTPEGIAYAKFIDGITMRRLRVILTQGLKRQVRHMFAAFDYEVKRLERIRIGNLEDPDLPQGQHRLLGRRDIERMLGYSDLKRRDSAD